MRFMEDRVGEDFGGIILSLHEVWILCGAG